MLVEDMKGKVVCVVDGQCKSKMFTMISTFHIHITNVIIWKALTRFTSLCSVDVRYKVFIRTLSKKTIKRQAPRIQVKSISLKSIEKELKVKEEDEALRI